jgi:maltooligosyltrehalose trehalohydrolase
MTSIAVWAPDPARVHLVVGDCRIAMLRNDEGWWRADTSLAPGTDYAFDLGDGVLLPDPRSPFQPTGVHGPSRTVDHGAFAWRDRGWRPPPLSSAVLYELHIGTFSRAGTFVGAIEHLSHLVSLGITHVELMPVHQFPGTRGWGYDGVGLYAPHAGYGGPEGLKQLVDACHGHGLAVILDVVYNHVGPAGNYLPRFGPYFTQRHETPWGSAANLDGPGSDEVRRFFCDNALGWLRDYHVDGLRIDAVHAFFDTSAVHFLEQLAEEVTALEAALGRHLVLIAESDLNDPRLVRSRDAGGFGLDAHWSDDIHHALHAALTGERHGYYVDFGTLHDVARALERAYVYDGRRSLFRRRRHGRSAAGLSGHRFVAYLQNHDQVGNRALGERSGRLMSHGRLKIGAALVLTSPFVPLLFQGEEWGASSPFEYFVDHDDPDLARAILEGRRQEFAAFGWRPDDIPDPQAPTTFERSRLDWNEREKTDHDDLLAWHRDLIALRRSMPDLVDGRLPEVAVSDSDGQAWLSMQRGRLTVVCNLSNQPQRVPLARSAPTRVRLASAPGVAHVGDAVDLPGESVAILQAVEHS